MSINIITGIKEGLSLQILQTLQVLKGQQEDIMKNLPTNSTVQVK